MAKAVGVGGVFLKAQDPKLLAGMQSSLASHKPMKARCFSTVRDRSE
jgi:hypothetical protein